MAFKEVVTLDADVTIALGGFNKKTKKNNPTKIEGFYLGSKQVKSPKSNNGKAWLHYFQTAKGNVAVWGKTDSDRKILDVTPGNMTRVSFDKMVPTPNGEMYKYKVEVDDTNTIEVDFASGGTQEDASEDSGEEYSASSDEDEPAQYEDAADYNDEPEVDEDAVQAATLKSLENKKRLETLLKGKNPKTANK